VAKVKGFIEVHVKGYPALVKAEEIQVVGNDPKRGVALLFGQNRSAIYVSDSYEDVVKAIQEAV
jgi:hypothetical protein